MAELKIVAVLIVKAAYQNELEKVFRTLVDATRKEEGNISYDLHQNTDNPLQYTILEVWKSEDAIASHNNSPHFKAFVSAIEGKIENLAVDTIKLIY